MKKLFTRTGREQELQIPFEYERLEKDEIRLLQLHESSGHGSAKTLSADLKTIRLHNNDGSASTEFEALSYYWGTEKADRPLSLNGAPFFIRPNLHAALRELCKGKTERVLWIDAICINQADVDERSEQVRMMSSIYQHAARVIIWIGPHWPERKGVAAEAIRGFVRRQRRGTASQQLSSFLENPNDRLDFIKFETKTVDYTGGHWPALVDFFDRPWWRRVWVR